MTTMNLNTWWIRKPSDTCPAELRGLAMLALETEGTSVLLSGQGATVRIWVSEEALARDYAPMDVPASVDAAEKAAVPRSSPTATGRIRLGKE